MSQLSPDQWQALSPLLDLALEMTDEERTTWLIAFRQENPSCSVAIGIAASRTW